VLSPPRVLASSPRILQLQSGCSILRKMQPSNRQHFVAKGMLRCGRPGVSTWSLTSRSLMSAPGYQIPPAQIDVGCGLDRPYSASVRLSTLERRQSAAPRPAFRARQSVATRPSGVDFRKCLTGPATGSLAASPSSIARPSSPRASVGHIQAVATSRGSAPLGPATTCSPRGRAQGTHAAGSSGVCIRIQNRFTLPARPDSRGDARRGQTGREVPQAPRNAWQGRERRSMAAGCGG
jgi:hypothetical protein